ncbi:hypothetical protein D8674_024364 [Pyrus ussuriensis x Pyrus communis]|uniref:Oxidoreductase-like domain-containing protein n=1 Tax=Pyrus ussuriensis x Pyrus communis TaxID=2448454 RepID=A0A5N5H7S2_9ROSA|nr:hypothetical protein D8674_024364 [Pyrus ussuriensis x Pyrus communis]
MADRGGHTAPTIKSANKITAATPPEKPELRDCCGNGCFRCVWNAYSDKEEA